MVGKTPPRTDQALAEEIEPEELAARIGALPGVDRLRAAAGGSAHLVGGIVRDLLLGRERVDIDVVVEGDAAALARDLDPEAVVHERFGTASARFDGLHYDIASARSETYPHPGALPEVRTGGLAEDLARRDFTVNAMAVPLDGGALVDPHGGAHDLADRVLRVLHDRSFADDPTRALRAARYASRLGFEVEEATLEQLRAADLGTVSEQRVEAELRRIAMEADPPAAIALAAEWGLLDVTGDDLALLKRALATLREAPWPALATAPGVVAAVALRAKGGPLQQARTLAAAKPTGASAGVEAAHGHDGTTLLLARAAGAEWVQSYAADWRHIRLEISGDDLMAAGVEQGPAIGRGLSAALKAKLDGEASGRDDELRVALEAAR